MYLLYKKVFFKSFINIKKIMFRLFKFNNNISYSILKPNSKNKTKFYIKFRLNNINIFLF